MTDAPYRGPERRQHERRQTPVQAIGRARVRPEHARHALSLEPGRWYELITPPGHILTPPLEGYVWINLDGQARTFPAPWFEIEHD